MPDPSDDVTRLDVIAFKLGTADAETTARVEALLADQCAMPRCANCDHDIGWVGEKLVHTNTCSRICNPNKTFGDDNIATAKDGATIPTLE